MLTKDLTYTPTTETLVEMLLGPLDRHGITDIPPSPIAFDEHWSAADAVREYRRRRAEEKRRQLIEMLTERLHELPDEALCKVCSFVEDVGL